MSLGYKIPAFMEMKNLHGVERHWAKGITSKIYSMLEDNSAIGKKVEQCKQHQDVWGLCWG